MIITGKNQSGLKLQRNDSDSSRVILFTSIINHHQPSLPMTIQLCSLLLNFEAHDAEFGRALGRHLDSHGKQMASRSKVRVQVSLPSRKRSRKNVWASAAATCSKSTKTEMETCGMRLNTFFQHKLSAIIEHSPARWLECCWSHSFSMFKNP